MMYKVAASVALVAGAEAADWVYANPGATAADRAAQEATWGGLCATGREQSPIDVVTSNTFRGPLPNIETHIDADASFVKNTGHGFQLFETSPLLHNMSDTGIVDSIEGSSKGYSMLGEDKYNFYQVHWHSPSENTVDGKFYPLEAHFVHQLEDPGLVGTFHRLAVIGVMYELGECNEFLDQFWAEFPQTAGSAPYTGANFDLNTKLAEVITHGYWHWAGSLTTPPCTEGVSWNLLKKPMTVCQRQINALTAALATTQGGVPFNNRVVQPLNHRIVADTTSLAPSPPPPPSNPPGAKWYYANDNSGAADPIVQYNTWGQVAPLCNSGKEQSPIDIDTSKVVDMSMKPITAHFDATTEYVKNTGHGFQLFETHPFQHTLEATNTPETISGEDKGYSMIRDQKYNFYQVHWHSPSENTIDGKSYPLEAHFVHQFDDPLLHGTFHRLAVIGLMYELGECNEFLDKFWEEFPTDKGISEYTGDSFDLSNKLTYELTQGYWHWYGSLTTPPCTESVSWNLLKKTETVCQRQVDKLQQALAQTQNGVSVNNRVVQPLNHRVVVGSSGSATASSPPPATASPPASTPSPQPTNLPSNGGPLPDDDDDDHASGIEIALLAFAIVIALGIFALIFMSYHLISRASGAASGPQATQSVTKTSAGVSTV